MHIHIHISCISIHQKKELTGPILLIFLMGGQLSSNAWQVTTSGAHHWSVSGPLKPNLSRQLWRGVMEIHEDSPNSPEKVWSWILTPQLGSFGSFVVAYTFNCFGSSGPWAENESLSSVRYPVVLWYTPRNYQHPRTKGTLKSSTRNPHVQKAIWPTYSWHHLCMAQTWHAKIDNTSSGRSGPGGY